MFAIGGNPQAAVVSGINVAVTLVIIYVIAGALYGVGGILEAARTGGATNNYGNMYELDAIAASVVGWCIHHWWYRYCTWYYRWCVDLYSY